MISLRADAVAVAIAAVPMLFLMLGTRYHRRVDRAVGDPA